MSWRHRVVRSPQQIHVARPHAAFALVHVSDRHLAELRRGVATRSARVLDIQGERRLRRLDHHDAHQRLVVRKDTLQFQHLRHAQHHLERRPRRVQALFRRVQLARPAGEHVDVVDYVQRERLQQGDPGAFKRVARNDFAFICTWSGLLCMLSHRSSTASLASCEV